MAKLAWKERTSTHQRFCCISGGLTNVLWYQRQCWKYEFFFKYFVYLFLESEQGREKERERNINVWLPLTWPPLGTWPTTQACVLTGNWSGDPLVRSPCSIHWATPAGLSCNLKKHKHWWGRNKIFIFISYIITCIKYPKESLKKLEK